MKSNDIVNLIIVLIIGVVAGQMLFDVFGG